MVICLAAFIVLLLGMVFWPLVRLFDKRAAKRLLSAFRAAVECIKKRTTFQKCEIRFEDRVKNAILKRMVTKHPSFTKFVAFAINLLSVLVILLFIFVVFVAFLLIFRVAY
ncbi:MAG: hypothetical protein LBL84_00985 [Candidatus Nomurabacteria bacterium]|jgi:hypothetical protein|nr:hypothetical protein [Candidatus Nomurabacteria bacterium]